MARRPSAGRAVILRICVFVMAAAGLGLTASGPALASCAGPQLRLQQDGASLAPRRVGDGLDEQVLYDVDRRRPLHVEAFNLTFDCDDTAGGTSGCGAPRAAPIAPVQPIRDAVLQLEQQNRRWDLADLETGPDLSGSVDVRIPSAVRPGQALLTITDPEHGDSAELSLVVS